MYRVSFQQFMHFVEQGRRKAVRASIQDKAAEQPREKALRPDQKIPSKRQESRGKLATCPACDALVNAEVLHPRSGLCPKCHAEKDR
jgi:hypothetical protein